MMRIALLALAAIATAAAPAAAQQKYSKAERALIALTPEQIAAMVKVTNDPLDTTVRVDSSPVYQQKDGLLKIVNGDKFLRAFIDRRTGKTALQLYVYATHGGEWWFWNRGVAEGKDGPVDLPGHRIDGDVSCSRYGCSYREDVALDVTEDQLRWAAQGAQAGVDATWKFKIFGKSVEGVTTAIQKTEVAGFLIALDRTRDALKIPKATDSN